MREIKFRVWDKEEKLMIDADNAVIFPTDGETLSEFFKEQQEYFEFMQCTGLKDKKGKEVYEGDIVKVDWDRRENEENYLNNLSNPFVIEFRNYGWFPFPHGVPGSDDIEIIGNIFQNPELLNK